MGLSLLYYLQVRGIQDSLRAMFNPHFGSTFRSHNNPTYFSRKLFRSLTQFSIQTRKSGKGKTWLHSGFLTSIQAVWRIFFNTVSTTPSTRGLRSWFVCCHNFFPQEGCPSPWVQDLVCLKEAALPLDLKSGLNTAWIFWSCSNNISLLYFGCAFVREILLCWYY